MKLRNQSCQLILGHYKESFEAMKDSENLKSNPSVKEKIFKAFRNYFNA